MLKNNKHNDVLMAKGSVPSKRGVMDIYVFLIDGMLVDTGPASLLSEYAAFFNRNDIEKVILTHHHEDHTGGAKYMVQTLNIPVYMHKAGIDICRTDGDYPLYREMVWGRREGFHAQALHNTVHSRHMKWEVIHSPGHALDHVVLYNAESGILFAGDLLVSSKPKLILASESIPEMIDSIAHVLQYDFRYLYCCHRGYVENGRELLSVKYNYLLEMSTRIIEMHKKGFTNEEIQYELWPDPNPIIELSNHDWDTMNFVTSVLQHIRTTD